MVIYYIFFRLANADILALDEISEDIESEIADGGDAGGMMLRVVR